MNILVSMVNYIRKNALAHRQFKTFLEERDAQYENVLYIFRIKVVE